MTGAQTDQHSAPDGATVHDFDAFWAAYSAGERERVRIRGVEVTLPTDVPLSMQMRDIGEPGNFDPKAVFEVVESMYGKDAVTAWTEAGMGLNELGVVVAWTSLRVQGEKVSFAEAIERVEKMNAEQAEATAQRQEANAKLSAAAGDSAQARADRAAAEALVDAGKAQWSGSGAPSRPTSVGSTGSVPGSWLPSAPVSSSSS